MKELIGKCKNCLGCNKLENPEWKGTYRCEYATSEQLSVEQIREELKKNGNK